MQKHTKKALILSVLSLMLCVSMLVGTTFAWFTDSVTTGVNVIQSGTLDIELEYSKDMKDWAKAENATDVLNPEALWEPGHTEVVYLRITNKGDLALKYQFAMRILDTVIGKSVLGNEINLADYLVYDIVDADAAYADRDEARAAVKDAHKLVGEIVSGEMTKKDESKTLALIVYMPETVGNEANYREVAPSINLSFNLFATQYTYESDSFDNQYDANAPFSVWDGVVPTEMPDTLVVDGATQTVHVKDAAAFAYLSTLSAKWADFYTDGNGRTFTNYDNGAGTNYYYSGNWTVSLEADIDLNNKTLAPVEIVFGENCGYSSFNGNYHVIRNIKATTGLFADMTRTNYANLVLENVKAEKGALTGVSGSSITNVTVKNAAISGADYIGGLVGRVFGNVSGCKVVDSSVIATGKEAGGLIGYAEANSAGFSIANNVVENVTVYANERAAGLVAQPNVNIKVYGNVVDTVTVGVADTTKYQPGAVVSNALSPENVYGNTVKNATVSTNAAGANDKASLDAAIASGADTVFVNSGEYTFPASNIKAGTTLICTPGTVFDGKTGLNINGATVVGGTFTNDNNYLVNSTTINGTFKDCVFTDCDGLRYCYAGETVVFENCVFDTDFYGIHFDGGANDVVFKNCTFTGFNTFGSAVTKLTLENCTFKYNGKGGYNGINLWGNSELINCTFVFDGSASYEWVDLCSDGKTVTFTNCVVTDGITETPIKDVVGNYGDGNTIIIDGVTVDIPNMN